MVERGAAAEALRMINPYLNRTAIRDDVSFVGRAAELKRLFNRIGGPQPQSVSIVGDRRIGKSSLLRAVLARRGKFLSKPEGYLFAYLDMQSRLRWTPEMFFERLAAEMASAGVDASGITDYDGLERSCRALQQEGHALVLLMDEFHVLMRDDAAGQLPVEFFNYLRSLANSYPVSLVVTSHVDLYTLSKRTSAVRVAAVQHPAQAASGSFRRGGSARTDRDRIAPGRMRALRRRTVDHRPRRLPSALPADSVQRGVRLAHRKRRRRAARS